MTAEIAILNKQAVALAADSAVTVGNELNRKVFLSANKLFCLSKYEPVGIMIFGNATFMDIPWETIVKYYRSSLGNKNFDKLSGYAEHFINFITENEVFSSPDIQNNFVEKYISGYFENKIKADILNNFNKEFEAAGQLQEDKAKEIVKRVINNIKDDFTKTPMLFSFDQSDTSRLNDLYSEIIKTIITKIFEQLPLDTEEKENLTLIGIDLLTKDIFGPNHSGIVVAGFGKKEIFPNLLSYLIEGIIGDKLKYRPHRTSNITTGVDAEIIPFAQSEMAHIFMLGIDLGYRAFIFQWLEEMFNKYPDQIKDYIPSIDTSIVDSLKVKTKADLKIFLEKLNQFEKIIILILL